MLPLTKSDYLLFLTCPPELWYAKHQPSEYEAELSEEGLHIINQGIAIEQFAMQSFASQNIQVACQQVYQTAHLYAKADFVLTDPDTGELTIVECKSSSEVKDEFINDLAFQCIAAVEAGFLPRKAALLLINNQYTRNGQIEPLALFKYQDLTAEVRDRIPQTRMQIAKALDYLAGEAPRMQLHEYCGSKLDCPVLRSRYPSLPAYTVFDINRIGQPKLAQLLQNGIVSILDIPDDFKLSDKQQAQVLVAKNGKAHIDRVAIRESLHSLVYPLYFLDYESLQYGIPLFDGIRPYQQMVFQWSLHVLNAPNEPIQHHEYLADGSKRPTEEFAAALRTVVPMQGGTVVVWNKSFETTRNREMAEMHPEHAEFMNSLNHRIFDLMEIFNQQLYMHPAAKGSYSIKQILPILAPDLSYNDLEINQGMLASIRWYHLATGKIPDAEKPKTLENMKKYCHLDTLAMVAIYQALLKSVSD